MSQTATDPTMAFLDDFRHPDRWDAIVENVPLFIPHTRKAKDKDGREVEYHYTVEDLHRMARTINEKLQRYGVVLRGHEGHTLPPGSNPQSAQPQILAYGHGAHVGVFGPKQEPALMTTVYVRKGCKSRVAELPFRSAEVYPGTGELTGWAFLRTDPVLDMGLLRLERTDHCVFYGMGEAMADEMHPKGEEHIPHMPEGDPTGEPDGHEVDPVFHENFMRCMRRYMATDEAKRMLEPSKYGMASPSGTNTAMPGAGDKPVGKAAEKGTMHKENAELVTSGRDTDPVLYQRLEQLEAKTESLVTENKALRAANEELRLNYGRSESTRLVDQLVDVEGFALPHGKEKEVARLMKLTPAEREERVSEIRTCYQRDPSKMPEPPISDSPVEGPAADLGGREFELALQYQREQNLPWEECVARVKGKK